MIENSKSILKANIENIVEKDYQNIVFYGEVVSNITTSEFKASFEIRVDYIVIDKDNIINFKDKNVKFNSYINKNEILDIFPGDYVCILGKLDTISSYNNFKIFNYEDYMKRKNIYGSIDIEKSQDIKIIEKEYNKLILYRYKIIDFVIDRVTKNIRVHPGIMIGILIGNTDLIEDEVVENFNKSNISHILAVSGTHVSFIIVFVGVIIDKFINNYKFKKIILIIILIMFLYIIGFSASVARAVIMGILLLLSKLFYRKSDVLNNLLLSGVILLIINPYFIFDMGFLLSYLTTMGIIMFSSNIEKMFSKIKGKNIIYKIKEYIKTSVIISISANIMIIPIMSYSMNTISFTYIIPNLLIGPLVILLEILGIIYLIFPNFFLLNFSIELILYLVDYIALFCSKIPLSSITISSFNLLEIFIFYLGILAFYIILSKYSKQQLISKIEEIKKYLLTCINKNLSKIIILSIFIPCFIYMFFHCKNILFIQNKMEISFIDVGQGDCTFIKTKNSKKILIDGGGNENYNIGEKILKPYFLKRKIKKLDYIIISHLDYDHVGGIITLLDYIKVDKIILPIQFEKSNNLISLVEKIKENNIELIFLDAGDRILLDEETYIDVLWPDKENKVLENSINNNALVFKLNYEKFSMLFTGDIEYEAENAIIDKYKSSKGTFKSTVLKVAHHGADTSSIQKLIDLVSPKISLIGVGKNNNYGHPSSSVLERLKKLKSKIYRTDLDGEIIIIVNKYGIIEKIEKYK